LVAVDEVFSAIDDPIDQGGELFKRVGLLDQKVVTIIYCPNATDCMPQHTLGDIARYAGARHQRSCGPAQVVQDPARHSLAPITCTQLADLPIEFGLRFAPDRAPGR
jgi:hypothetical protein